MNTNTSPTPDAAYFAPRTTDEFNTWYQANKGLIILICVKRAKAYKLQHSDFHDMMQFATAHLWKQFHKYEPGRGKVNSFIGVVLSNACSEWKKSSLDSDKRRFEFERVASIDADSPLQHMLTMNSTSSDAAVERLVEILTTDATRLGFTQGQADYLKASHEHPHMTATDLAKHLNTTKQAVHTHRYKCIHRLQGLIDQRELHELVGIAELAKAGQGHESPSTTTITNTITTI